MSALVCSWKTLLDIIETCSSKKVHTVGELMRLPRSQAKPLFKKTGLQDGQIEAVKSMLKMIDGEWSDWSEGTRIQQCCCYVWRIFEV